MSKFTKLLIVLLLILLIEGILIYRGYTSSKDTFLPKVKDYNPNNSIVVINKYY